MNWDAHLAVYAVVLPLLTAPLCVLFGNRQLAWLLSLAAALAGLVSSLGLLHQVQLAGEIRYALGGWPAPWGIEYRVDLLSAFMLLLINSIAAMVFSYAPRSVETEVEPGHQVGLYAGMLLVQAGLSGIAVTGDAFNAFVFLEIASLASYALISLGADRRALTAAFQYLVMGSLGATFILIGIGFVYMMTGTLNFSDLAERLPAVAGASTTQAGFAFLTVGLALKVAMFPLHLWLPNAYAHAPTVVAAFLAATSTKIAAYLLVRVIYSVFGADFTFGQMSLQLILLPLASVAVISGSLVAVFQDDLKRMFAYSSVAQIGYILIGISLNNHAGLTASILHLFNHALMKGVLFLALGAIAWRIGSVRLNDLAGLGRRMPWTVGALIVGGLSLVGMPMTAGFINKWYLLDAVLVHAWWWLLPIIALGSLLAVAYLWRIIEVTCFRDCPGDSHRLEAPTSLLLPTWGLALANLYFGIDTRLTLGNAEAAAATLLGVAR